MRAPFQPCSLYAFREQEDDQATPFLLSLFDRPFNFTAGFAGFDGFSAVILLLALREPDLNLGMAALGEIDAEWNERQPLLLGPADQLVDFLPMQQQLSGPRRIMVHDVAVAVGADMALVQKDFVLMDGGVAVLQIHATFSKGFHFRPLEYDAGFKFLFDEIIVVGLPIGGHHLLLIVRGFGHITVPTGTTFLA